MKMKEYLNKAFSEVELIPSLYYQWDLSIHFTLGQNSYQLTDKGETNIGYFAKVYNQVHTIFNELFEGDDELFLVTNLYKYIGEKQPTRKLNVYNRYVKNKRLLTHLQVETYPYPFEIEEGKYEMQQFSLRCKVRDIKVNSLIKAAIHEDFPLKPKLGGYPPGYPDVFFVNVTKNVMLFIYDDRGCEVLGLDKQQMNNIYKKYRKWVDELDRGKIERSLQ